MRVESKSKMQDDSDDDWLDQPGLPGAFDGPGGIEANDVVGVKDNGVPCVNVAVAKGGLGERSCDSLLGEALSDGVADTRL